MLNNNKPMFNVYRKGIQIENKLKIHHKTLKLKKKKKHVMKNITESQYKTKHAI